MRVAIYCRVSTEDQADRGTIKDQTDFGAKYADLHQHEVIEWYIDDGVTGTIPLEDRPAGVKLMDAARAKRFDSVLVYRLDRLGRSARITLNAVYELERCGVQVRSMTEPFDTGDASGRFMLTILAGQADFERSTILDRLWHGANRHARAGEWLGGIIPYGYVRVDKRLQIDETELPGVGLSRAGVVRLIYQLCAEQDYTCRGIAEYLNARRIPPSYVVDGRQVRKGQRKESTAGIWRPGRIRNMLASSTYKGLHVYGKRSEKRRELIEREVPAIVDAKIWDRAQAVLREHQLSSIHNSHHDYLLRGLIKCGSCGLTYVGVHYSGAGKKHTGYYVCGGKQAYRGPLQGKCTNKNLPQEWIENLVWSQCVKFVRDPGEYIKELAAAMSTHKSQHEQLQAELEHVEAEIAGKSIEREAIMDLYRRRLISSTEVESQMAKIADERRGLEGRVEDLRARLRTDDILTSQAANVEALLSALRAKVEAGTFADRRTVVRALVKQIVVTTDEGPGGHKKASVTVHFAFSTGKSRTDKDSLRRQV